MTGAAADQDGRVTAILSAQTEAGRVWYDPSEDLLFELMTDLDSGDRLLWVLRLDAGDGDHFFRVELLTGGGEPDRDRFDLEHQDGEGGRHRRASDVPFRDAHAGLTAWAHRLSADVDPVPWR